MHSLSKSWSQSLCRNVVESPLRGGVSFLHWRVCVFGPLRNCFCGPMCLMRRQQRPNALSGGFILQWSVSLTQSSAKLLWSANIPFREFQHLLRSPYFRGCSNAICANDPQFEPGLGSYIFFGRVWMMSQAREQHGFSLVQVFDFGVHVFAYPGRPSAHMHKTRC